jgi:predicted deacetylase
MTVQLSKAVQWLEKADFEAKIVIAGRHKFTEAYLQCLRVKD